MVVSEQLGEVLDTLYGSYVATFTGERNRIAAALRKAGDKDVAQQVGSLAKPSRSAHAVNLLVRSDPEIGQSLSELGEELRDAEQGRDADRMRELATRRRRLIDGLVRQAFDLIGEDSPPVGQRDEVAATLNATLADPDVALHILAGTLVRPVRWEGFGSVPLTRISALPELPQRPAGKPSRPRKTPDEGKGNPEAAERLAAEQRKAVEAERRAQRQAEITDARRDAEAADTELDQVTDRLSTGEDTIRELEARLTDGQRALEQARTDLRRARARHREAHRVLDALQAHSGAAPDRSP